jgi:DHA1 family tetracycline resistance protein-like MFS transporter
MFANQFWAIWALYAAHRYGWGTMQIGLGFAFIGGAGGLVQIFAVEPVVRRIGERWATIVGVSLFTAALLLFGLAESGAVFLAAHVLLCLGGIGQPAFNAAMSRRVGADRQGELQGAMGALQGFSGLLGPLVFSGSFAFVASAGGRGLPIGTPFFIGAVFGLGALTLTRNAFFGRRRAAVVGAIAPAIAPVIGRE